MECGLSGCVAGVVKVRRGVVARYMVGIVSFPDLLRAFAHFAGVLASR